MKRFVAALCLLASMTSATAIELQGVKNTHDPGTITKDGDTYFNFTTGTGIWYSTCYQKSAQKCALFISSPEPSC